MDIRIFRESHGFNIAFINEEECPIGGRILKLI